MKRGIICLCIAAAMLNVTAFAESRFDSSDAGESISVEVIADNSQSMLGNNIQDDEERLEQSNGEEAESFAEAEYNKTEEDITLFNIENDIPEAEWIPQTDIKQESANPIMLNVSGMMYKIGGYNSGGEVSMISAYISSSDTWIKITNIPSVPQGYTAVAIDKKIYIIGGYRDGEYLSEMQVYDIATSSWTSGSAMIKKRDGAAAMVLDNKIYVFGGRDEYGINNDYEYYSFDDNRWHLVTAGFDAGLNRYGAKAGYVNGYVCMTGGFDTDYNRCGADLYLCSDMTQTEHIYNAYDEVLMVLGEKKGFIFLKNYTVSRYLIIEFTVDDGVYVTNRRGTSGLTAKQYAGVIMIEGYIYCAGGYDTNENIYSAQLYKYSVYYGDFTTGDGTITNQETQDGNSVTLNVEAGKEYVVFIKANNIMSFADKVFTLEYSPSAFEILDACAMTTKDDYALAPVENTNITLTEYKRNGVSFTVADTYGWKPVSTCVNAVRLYARDSGRQQIIYRMTTGEE